MTAYIEFEIMEGAYEVSCPDAMCPTQGIISIDEISKLAASHLVDKHHRYRLNRGIVFSVLMYFFFFLIHLCFNF